MSGTNDKPRIGFVIQRYGAEVVGGAETLCRMLAERLAARWRVEALTTCALDCVTWKNHYPAGEDSIEGVRVRRFPVARQRIPRRFNRLDRALCHRAHSLEEEREWMRLQGPDCPELTAYLEAHGREYDAFIFFGYLYATTFDNLPLVADRAWLMPFAHEEPPILLKIFEDVFRRPRGLLHCTPEERDFTRRRFGFQLPPSVVAGVGIELERPGDPARFRRKFGLEGPLVLYAGRIDQSKNADLLLDYFMEYKQRGPRPARPEDDPQLVLAGKSLIRIPDRCDVHYVGFLSEEDKRDAFAAAACFVLPSEFESLSIVLLESWAAGRPVLVNAACEVALGQTRRAQGGLWYANRGEFCAALRRLLADSALADQLGRQGREYVKSHYAWERICERICGALEQAKS